MKKKPTFSAAVRRIVWACCLVSSYLLNFFNAMFRRPVLLDAVHYSRGIEKRISVAIIYDSCLRPASLNYSGFDLNQGQRDSAHRVQGLNQGAGNAVAV